MPNIYGFEDKFVKCPFYKKSSPGEISCEGFEDGTSLKVTFNDRGRKIKYMRKRCESMEGYKYCHIHCMLERLYDEQ